MISGGPIKEYNGRTTIYLLFCVLLGGCGGLLLGYDNGVIVRPSLVLVSCACFPSRPQLKLWHLLNLLNTAIEGLSGYVHQRWSSASVPQESGVVLLALACLSALYQRLSAHGRACWLQGGVVAMDVSFPILWLLWYHCCPISVQLGCQAEPCICSIANHGAPALLGTSLLSAPFRDLASTMGCAVELLGEVFS